MNEITATPPNPVSAVPDEPKLPVAPANSDLHSMTTEDLERERRKLADSCKGNYDDLSEETLQRLAYITSTLRRRSSGPPKVAKESKQRAKGKPSLDDVLF